MTGELHDTCANLDADPGVRVLVLKGAGDRAFASGTDIRQFLDFKTREDALGYEARLTRVLARPAGMSKPTIAMLQGDAIGGGLFIALACDLRLAAPHARFGVPVARTLGNFLAPLSLSLLVAALGPSRARELVLTARLLDTAEAKGVGLIDRIHPAPELESRVRELAASLAELAPLTLAATKEATRRRRARLSRTAQTGLAGPLNRASRARGFSGTPDVANFSCWKDERWRISSSGLERLGTRVRPPAGWRASRSVGAALGRSRLRIPRPAEPASSCCSSC